MFKNIFYSVVIIIIIIIITGLFLAVDLYAAFHVYVPGQKETSYNKDNYNNYNSIEDIFKHIYYSCIAQA